MGRRPCDHSTPLRVKMKSPSPYNRANTYPNNNRKYLSRMGIGAKLTGPVAHHGFQLGKQKLQMRIIFYVRWPNYTVRRSRRNLLTVGHRAITFDWQMMNVDDYFFCFSSLVGLGRCRATDTEPCTHSWTPNRCSHIIWWQFRVIFLPSIPMVRTKNVWLMSIKLVYFVWTYCTFGLAVLLSPQDWFFGWTSTTKKVTSFTNDVNVGEFGANCFLFLLALLGEPRRIIISPLQFNYANFITLTHHHC